MIPNKEKEGWHCLAVKNLPALLRGITSRHHGGFYYLNCLHFFRTENKLKSHKKVCVNKDICGTVMPSEKDKILEFKHYMKSDKMPYIIYAGIEPLIKKRDEYENEKIFNNKNRWGYSLWIFNVNNLGIWSYRRQTYFILSKRLYENVLWIFKRVHKKNNWFWKKCYRWQEEN